MKSTFLAALTALAVERAAGHSLFQQLWVDGTDMGTQCSRVPMSNTPVTNVGGADVRCNVGGGRGVASKCPVAAGGVVTVEMHAQPGDRSCTNEAIGGAHYGPVMVYLSKVPDSQAADGSSDWFKVYQNSWTSAGGVGDNDNWGVKDMNKCCGKVDVPIPASLPDGDYLLRAEVVALHAMPAQLYMTCYQLTLSGGAAGGTVPAGVKFPGAYSSSDPGLTANIHSALTTYKAPGPAVADIGTEAVAGSGCSGGCAGTCKAGAAPGVVLPVSEAPAAAGGAAGASSCEVGAYQQCGGNGYTGCSSCVSGYRCDTSNQYYHQCTA